MGKAVSSVVAQLVLVVAAASVRVTTAVEVVKGASDVLPALWVFGDSLADAGNNNNFRTLAKANHPPYGRDFPNHVATGRFVNGYNAIDYLAMTLGLPLVPIYESPSTTGTNLLKGVNFASAASGITSYAGLNFGKVTSLDGQIKQFASVKEEVIQVIGDVAANDLFAKSLFYIVTGSNDWLNTYYFIGSPLPKIYTVPQYRDMLITKFLSQIEDLYNLGARRIAVAGLGALGCSPSQLRTYNSTDGSCIVFLNDLCKDFNDQLRPALLALPTTKLPGTVFLFNDLYVVLLEAVRNPSAFGFSIADQACCGIGKYGGFLNCFQGFPSCTNDEIYLYWDAYHPNSKFIEQLVDILWNKGPPYSYPVSGRQLLGSL